MQLVLFWLKRQIGHEGNFRQMIPLPEATSHAPVAFSFIQASL
jgi:hypothetical protein